LLTLKTVFGKWRFNTIRLPMVIFVLDHAHAPGQLALTARLRRGARAAVVGSPDIGLRSDR
jgi:hypothetical protein